MSNFVTLSVYCFSVFIQSIKTENHEMKLIDQLNNHFNFDHNIFLFELSIDTNRFIDTSGTSSSLTPKSVYKFSSGSQGVPELINLEKIGSKNALMIVVPGSVKLDKNLNLLSHVKRIQLLQLNMKIGIFYPQIAFNDDLHDLFKWSWKQRIINIFAATKPSTDSLHVFTFNPFGTFQVINVTHSSDSYDRFFLRQNSNFHKYPILLLDFRNDQYDRNLWFTVLGVLNVSYVKLPLFGLNDSMASISDNLLSICYARFTLTEVNKQTVYPWEMKHVGVLVPEALPYIGFTAYLRVLTTYKLLAYISIMIAAIIISLSLFRFKRQKKILVLNSIVDVFNLLMNDNGNIKYQRLSGTELMIIVPLTFAGLIIVNGILSALQSLFTRPIIQPQINSVEDLYNSPFFIYTIDEFWKNFTANLLTNQLRDANWADKVRILDYYQFENQKLAFNRSMSFMRDTMVANVEVAAQKRLNIYGHHISNVHLSSRFDYYPINNDLPFLERINEIIFWLIQSGITKKWKEDILFEYENDIVKVSPMALSNRKETTIDGFEMPTFILYGWVVSSIVFLIEIAWIKLKFFVGKHVVKSSSTKNDAFTC